MPTPLEIFVTGGTGYIGQQLIPALLARGHRVRALARQESLSRVPAGTTTVVGDALQVDSVTAAIRPGDTVVHLVGTPHPTPSKADQFEKVDLASIRATVSAAKQVGISHLIYLSVAQPAPIMQAYLWVRALGESMIREARLTATNCPSMVCSRSGRPVAESDRTALQDCRNDSRDPSHCRAFRSCDHRADGRCDCLRAGESARAGPTKNRRCARNPARSLVKDLYVSSRSEYFREASETNRARRFPNSF